MRPGSDWLLRMLEQFPQAGSCHLAFSGGLDSSVLLHLLSEIRTRLPMPIRALHVHHGLQAGADAWERHCAARCRELAIPYRSLQVELPALAGESLEARARELRYQALAAELGEGDLLLTAQHQDDQAETLLLQLLRGAGPAGLAAMPARARCGAGWLLRPLLDCSRSELEAYARARGIGWVEDPSNQDPRFDRNFLRHEVMPLLRRRWPAVAATLARSARLSAELSELGGELAAQDLAACVGAGPGRLSVGALRALPAPRVRNLLRHWVQRQGGTPPGSRHLQRLLDECLDSRPDAQPLVRWADQEVRRFGGELFLLEPLPPHDPGRRLEWPDQTPLRLPAGLGELVLEPVEAGISARRWAAARVEVRFRQGGERCRPAGSAHHRRLKELMRVWGIPPWERERIPLVYLDGELAAIPDHLWCEPFDAPAGARALLPRWRRP